MTFYILSIYCCKNVPQNFMVFNMLSIIQSVSFCKSKCQLRGKTYAENVLINTLPAGICYLLKTASKGIFVK